MTEEVVENVKPRFFSKAWFEKILKRNPKIELLEFSDLYANKGTNKYYRVYAEVKKRNVKE